ncbi:MAG: AAA family ATPase [Candidatus Uhrbacteria bacterium]
MKNIYFITGVCGVGKTSLILHLKKLLGDNFVIHDFDEDGVPEGVDRKWRITKTKEWIQKGVDNMKKGKVTIITGFSNPVEIEKMEHHEKVRMILLDATGAIVRKRLQQRYLDESQIEVLKNVTGDSVEAFILDNQQFASKLRSICKIHKCEIIKTDNLNPEETAEQVASIIRS